MIKQAGGVLHPASDIDAESLQKFKTGEQYQIEIKRSRNPQFHRKVFAFFGFCFEHWASDREFMDEKGQREVFRNHLTVLAGYRTEHFNLKNEVRIEAKSLSFASMSQEDFEQCYQALIAAAMRTIFKDAGREIEDKLIGFF